MTTSNIYIFQYKFSVKIVMFKINIIIFFLLASVVSDGTIEGTVAASLFGQRLVSDWKF